MITGNRRSSEELEIYKKEHLNTKFKLKDQKNFNGSIELLNLMQEYERAYREGHSIISDEEWDKLVNQTGYEESLDEIVSPSGRNWVKMTSPLPSLKKAVSIDEAKNFISKFSKGTKFIVEPKLDGLTFNALYKKDNEGNFYYNGITTRGDGLNGLRIHKDALTGVEIFGLPNYISKEDASYLEKQGCIINDKIEIRGEAIIDKDKYLRENPDVDKEKFVPRSIAAGIFNRIDACNIFYLSHKIFLMEPYIPYYKESKDNSDLFENIWNSYSREVKKLLSSYGLINTRSYNNAYDAVVLVFDKDTHLKFFGKYKNKWVNIEENFTGKLKKEHLYFITYSISSKDGNIDDFEILNKLSSFKDNYENHFIYIHQIPDFVKITTITESFDEIVNCIDNFYGTVNGIRDICKTRLKNVLRFACDGIVIKPSNSNYETQKMNPKLVRGKIVIPKYPMDQIAIKLPTDPVKTKIIKINYKTTKLGNTTISADIEPVVAEGGAVVKSVNLHNPNWLNLPENEWIKEGAECNLRLSMDIIPIIEKI